MFDIPSLRPESRYGIPTSDLLLFNRQYVVGYSYLFRQPRWAAQVVDDSTKHMTSDDFDRGHLINSADRKSSKLMRHPS